MDLIGDETAIENLRQLALETAEGLTRRLVLGEFALVVVSAGPRMHRLDTSGEVQRVVDRPIAAPGQAVPGDLAARHLDRSRAGVAREAIRRGEAANVAGVAEDLRGKHLADPKDRGERRAARSHGTRATSPVLHEGPIDPPQVSHECASHRLALEVGRNLRPTLDWLTQQLLITVRPPAWRCMLTATSRDGACGYVGPLYG